MRRFKNPESVIFAMASSIEEMREEHAELKAALTDIKNKYENGDLSDEDLEELGFFNKAEDLASLEAKIKAAVRDSAFAGLSLGGKGSRKTTDAPKVDAKRNTVPAAPKVNDGTGGFQHLGDFSKAVMRAVIDPSATDSRLLNSANTYGNEGTGSDGGFLVPQTYQDQIWKKVLEEDSLLARCTRMRTGTNNLTLPKDETTPWQTTGGIQAYWENEGSIATASKPALETVNYRLNKLFALVPITEELREDAVGLESWLSMAAPGKMAAKINTAIIDGTGAAQPSGILRSNCTISVAAESSQTADTIEFENINKMWSRMYAPCRRNAVWLINQDIEPQLSGMQFKSGSASPVPVFLPQNSIANTPYATLYGRPIIPVEACKALGDKGDIILADLNQYMILTKSGQEIRRDVSIHLYFDQALTAYRFMFRLNGAPLWNSPVARQHGSNTLSCFVTLDERS